MQNIQSNLVDKGNMGNFTGSVTNYRGTDLPGYYWSSTEYQQDPGRRAWAHRFELSTDRVCNSMV